MAETWAIRGTSVTWTSIGFKHDSPNFNTKDVDEDGLLDAGVDHYTGSGNTFTGYTITSGGIEY